METLLVIAGTVAALAVVAFASAALLLRRSRTAGLAAMALVVAIALAIGGGLVIAGTIITAEGPLEERGLQIFAGLVLISSLLMSVRFAQVLREQLRRR